MRSPKVLIGLGAAVLILSWFGSLKGASWWPWEPFRVCIAGAATVGLLAWPGRAAIVAFAVWAFVAAPLAVRQEDRGFTDAPRGALLATGVPSGPFLLRTGAVPIGWTGFRGAEKTYLDGEGSDADSELVAWSLTWLPWPHLDRTQIIGLGGNTIDFWAFPGNVEVRRDGRELVVSSKRNDEATRRDRPEVRALHLGWTASWITVLGWCAVLVAGVIRAITAVDELVARRHREKRARQRAGRP